MIRLVKTQNYDYISNTNPTFQMVLTIFSQTLIEAKKAKSSYDKEHVTPFIIRNTKNFIIFL